MAMMRTKVRAGVAICVMTATVAMGMTGCGGSKENSTTELPSGGSEITAKTNAPEKLNLDVDKLAQKIANCGGFTDELSELDAELFDSQYTDVNMDSIVNKCAYIGTGATVEQIVVVEAKDSDSAKKVKEALQSKIDADIEANKDYKPKELPKLKSPILEVKEQYVIMAVANDNDKVEAVVENECK